jgi:hypothetical protein
VDSPKKIPIAFIMDDRISREKVGVLSHKIQSLRQQFAVQVIKAEETSEDDLIQRVEKKEFQLILAPVHKYQEWARLEGAFGASRTSGPTFAGYFCEPVPFYQLPEPRGQHRSILLDFTHLSSEELVVLVRSVLIDSARSGLRPLLETNALIYCESWYGSQGQGSRIDAILGLNEIAKTLWIKRSSAIRIILSALWSMIYEEGPGKTDSSSLPHPDRVPKAYFQLGADATTLVFRLCFYHAPHCTPKEALQKFWPDATAPTRAAQLLVKFSDFVRVHTLADTSDIEVVVGFFNSAPAEKNPNEAHSLWIEPIAARLYLEPPYEAPGPQAPHLRALPNVSLAHPRPRALEAANDSSNPAKNQVILAATAKIKELKNKVAEQNETIHELRTGGIGTTHVLPPPDIEALLEAFQQRYFEARYEIRQFEIQIEEMQKRGANPKKMETLRLKMEALANRERAWIKKLVATLETYKEARRRTLGNRSE